MLRAMRGAAQTWAIKLLLIFLVISFAIWGVGDMFRGNPQQRLVACIGGLYLPFRFLFNSSASICTGKHITVQNLQSEFQRSFELERQKKGPEFTLKAARQMGFMERALGAIIDRELFGRTVTETGLQFDEPMILKELTNAGGMKNKEGNLDVEAFRNAARKMHMTEQEFLDFVRKSVQNDLTLATIAALAAPPKALTDEVRTAHGQEREIQVLRLTHDSLPVPAGPNDEERRQYHAAHGGQFIAPEYRNVSILEILVDDIVKNTSITDQDVAAAFEKRRDEFALPERRDLFQVILHDEAKANEVVAAAKNRKDLKKVAADQQLNPIILNDQTEQNILPSLFTNVFTADAGAIIGPIKTDYGWHVLQLTAIKPPTKPTLTEIKEPLRIKMQHERAVEEIQNLANKVDDDLAGGKSLEEIAETYKFKLTKYPAIDAAGNTEAGKYAGLPMPDTTLKNAFGLNEGESSSLIDDHRGNYLVVHVDKVMPSHVRELATIQDKVDAAWRKDQQTRSAATEATKLADLWRKGANAYNDIIKQRGISAVAAPPVSLLSGFPESLPNRMQKDVFTLKPGEVAVGADKDAHYLVRLTGYKASDTAKNADKQKTLQQNLTRAWQESVIEQYERALENDTPTYINKELLAELQNAAVPGE